ncbi:hypothetical protein GJ744_002227 [Endocarpon pusillum]|uniref:Uncharacterized protein n=1 Tax=Endocarpon pusillum TaxID=364733 RepID=A0A8H7A8C8_9EURO|nr:hypothetical protein GJ744_002227 [Endocarpon pusillum]
MSMEHYEVPRDSLQLFQRKLDKISKSVLDNLVDARIVNERGMLSPELPEAGGAETLAILTDNPAEASIEGVRLAED